MIDVYALASCLSVSVYLWVHWCVVCYYNVFWTCSSDVCKRCHVFVTVCTGVLVRFRWSRVVSQCRTSIILMHITFIYNSNFEKVEEFKYLGKTLTKQNYIPEEINPSAWSDGHCPHAARSHSFVYISTS